LWRDIDVLVTPTAGTIYRIDQVNADPVRLNTNLGYYTNFVNLLDLAAVAVPAGRRDDGLPFGVSLVAPAGSDACLLESGAALHAATSGVALQSVTASLAPPRGHVAIAVCGAHMTGLPLNHQLTSRGACFMRRTRTAPKYRFVALPGGPPLRPGLVRLATHGAGIEVELWAVPESELGSFVAAIPSPLAIGKVELEDGSLSSGFLCESHAAEGALDITSYGGWRAYLAGSGKA
jgi:allophanate hydrolase